MLFSFALSDVYVVAQTAEFDGLVKVQRNGKWGYVDKSGSEIIPCEWDAIDNCTDCVAVVKKNRNYGLINKNNELVLPCEYTEAIKIAEYNCFAFFKGIESDALVTVVNSSGKILTTCKMSELRNVDDRIFEDNRNGVNESNGNIVYNNSSQAEQSKNKGNEFSNPTNPRSSNNSIVKDSDGNEDYVVNGVSFKMVTVKGGTFSMGATSEQGNDAYATERPAHRVSVSDFAIGQTEVTQALWLAVMGNNPSFFSIRNSRYGENLQRPVECVTYNSCKEFISKLNELTGKKFRLPTEAEWEFAARGGNKSRGYKYAGSNTIGDVAWYYGNMTSHDIDSKYYGTHSVATKAPNELGLYDMTGNVSEWCQDRFGGYGRDLEIDPTGSTDENAARINRGGSYDQEARDCRVSSRDWTGDSFGGTGIGLRLAM